MTPRLSFIEHKLREMTIAHKIERDRNIKLEEMEKENRELLRIERMKYERVCEANKYLREQIESAKENEHSRRRGLQLRR